MSEGTARLLYDDQRYVVVTAVKTSPAKAKAPGHKAIRSKGRRVAAKPAPVPNKDANLLVRFDHGSKSLVQRAAAARGLSVSDYVRTRILSLARQDIVEAETQVLRLSREDQIVLWQALQQPRPPTAAQRRLGKLIRSVM
jgi:uncharacterized protein (DUF1778 family)